MLLDVDCIEKDNGVLVTINNKSQFFPDACTESIILGYLSYYLGLKIQDAFPFLNKDQREFLMTGTTPEEWDQLFSKEN